MKIQQNLFIVTKDPHFIKECTRGIENLRNYLLPTPLPPPAKKKQKTIFLHLLVRCFGNHRRVESQATQMKYMCSNQNGSFPKKKHRGQTYMSKKLLLPKTSRSIPPEVSVFQDVLQGGPYTSYNKWSCDPYK